VILLKNIGHLIQDAETVKCGMDLLVEGSKIAAIDRGVPEKSADEVIDCRGRIVMPGFINLHTHLYQSVLKGWGDTLTLKPWCEEVTFPFSSIIHASERDGDYRMSYAYAILGAMEMLHAGITTFVDMDILSDSVFQAWHDLGVRGVGAIQAVNRWVPKPLMVPDDVRKKRIFRTVDLWDRKDLLRVAIAPSTPFACTEEFLLWLRDLALENNMPLFIHVSETKWEVEDSLRSTGMTPLEYLESIQFLKAPVCAVHAIHFTKEEHGIAQSRGVSICYNPKSNGKLGSGIAPIVEYLRLGLKVAVSTDGAASNDLLDLFEDMRVGLMLQKLRYEDPSVISAQDVFRMATETPAEILGLNAGILRPGKLADLVILDPEQVHFGPLHDAVQQIVYCGKSCDVRDVMVNGKFLMKDARILTVDEPVLVRQGFELASEKLDSLTGEALEAEF